MDIDQNRDRVDLVEASFNDLETVLRVLEQNLAVALRGRCRCTDRALEDLEPSFVDDPVPGLTRTGSSLSYLTVPNTSTPEPKEVSALPENVVPVPIREPSIPARPDEENVEVTLLQASYDEIERDIAWSFSRTPRSRSAAAEHREELASRAPGRMTVGQLSYPVVKLVTEPGLVALVKRRERGVGRRSCGPRRSRKPLG